MTIHGAIFESTQLKQDSPAERKNNVHGHNKLSKEGTVQHNDATTGENAGCGTSVRSGAASARQKRSMKRLQDHQERSHRLQDFQKAKRQQQLLRVWAGWKQQAAAAITSAQALINAPSIECMTAEIGERVDHKRARDRVDAPDLPELSYETDEELQLEYFMQQQMQPTLLPPSQPPLLPPQLPPSDAAINAARLRRLRSCLPLSLTATIGRALGQAGLDHPLLAWRRQAHGQADANEPG